MRVISGKYKGRNIKGYNIEGTRPTMDRVKASVFGSIQNYIKDSIVLDLFAGSGNLGIESLSNYSKYCYFIDNNKLCIKAINKTIKEFKIENAKVILSDYKKALLNFKNNNITFDIIFIDPPYKYENIMDIVNIIEDYKLLNQNGLLVLEFKYDNLELDANKYTLHKSKKYGDKYVHIYKK